jgi:hypothetical protein
VFREGVVHLLGFFNLAVAREFVSSWGRRGQKKRGAWQNHKRLSHSSINSYHTSLDHLLLDRDVDIPVIKPLIRTASGQFRLPRCPKME